MIVIDPPLCPNLCPNLFCSAHFLLNTSGSVMRALFCPHLWECCSILRAEGWDGVWRFLSQLWLSRGLGARGLHLPWNSAQQSTNQLPRYCSSHDRTLESGVQDVWTDVHTEGQQESGNSRGPGFPGRPAVALLTGPSLSMLNLPLNRYTHTRTCRPNPVTCNNRWAFSQTINPHVYEIIALMVHFNPSLISFSSDAT